MCEFGRNRLQVALATVEPPGIALASANPRPTTPIDPAATRSTGSRRQTSDTAVASSGAATSRPATSLSFPVTKPGYAAFRMWSLTTSTASAISVIGCANQANA